MVNTVIGNWKIERKLGEGGMGEVYLARHSYLGTLAALKILSTSLTGEPKFRERFFQEAQMQAQLVHPHIARVVDFIEQDGLFCQVVEYVSGGTAADAIQARGALPISLALRWTKQILSALQCAHLKGIIHRDIKPSNILLEQGGDAKLTDFGIALATGRGRLTTVGKSIGTPEYMSPEQISTPKEVDERSDIYAVGIALFEFLTGRVPFDSDSDFEIYQAQLRDPPPNIRLLNPSVPKQLEDILRKALKKKPSARYESCADFLGALEEFERRVPIEDIPATRLAGQTRTRPFRINKRLALIAVGLFILLIGATALYLWAQSVSRKAQLLTKAGPSASLPAASSNPTAATPQPVPEGIPETGPALVSKTIKEQNKRYTINVRFPQTTGSGQGLVEGFDQQVNALVRKLIDDFKEGANGEVEPDSLEAKMRSTLDIKYQVTAANAALISVEFDVVAYGAGAVHENIYTLVMNYDLKSGKPILLADLFKSNSDYMRVISNYCIAQLKKRGPGELSDDDWINRGAAASVENYQNWSIAKKGLVITFDPYQVASFAAGAQRVLVPYGSLKDVINPNSQIASFLK